MTAPTGPGGSVGFDPSNPLVGAAIGALPEDIQALLKPGKTSDRIQHAITWASRRDPAVVERHRARNPNVRTFEDIASVPLSQMDAVAHAIARSYRHRALLTGALTGLPGGLWLVVAAGIDVQLTAIYAVRMAAQVAQAYGYDTSALDEQAHLAEVLALMTGVDTLRGVGNYVTREGLTHLLPEILPRLMARMSVELSAGTGGQMGRAHYSRGGGDRRWHHRLQLPARRGEPCARLLPHALSQRARAGGAGCARCLAGAKRRHGRRHERGRARRRPRRRRFARDACRSARGTGRTAFSRTALSGGRGCYAVRHTACHTSTSVRGRACRAHPVAAETSQSARAPGHLSRHLRHPLLPGDRCGVWRAGSYHRACGGALNPRNRRRDPPPSQWRAHWKYGRAA